jgi:putative copper resistance protein D
VIDAALTAAGWVDLLATAALGGGLVYGVLVGERSEAGTRALGVAAGVLALALALEFGLTAQRMREVSGVRGTALVLDLLDARWGRLWLLRCLGLAMLSSPTRLGAALVPPWLLLRSLQGHAGAHGPVAALVDGVHLTAAAVWIGSLVQVALLPRAAAVQAARRLRALATVALGVLVPAGVYGAVVHLQRLDMVVGSAYGRTLAAKLALAAPLLVLGAANHFRHVPAITRGDPAAPARLSRTVRLEIALAAAVLLLSALLGVLPMPHVHAS